MAPRSPPHIHFLFSHPRTHTHTYARTENKNKQERNKKSPPRLPGDWINHGGAESPCLPQTPSSIYMSPTANANNKAARTPAVKQVIRVCANKTGSPLDAPPTRCINGLCGLKHLLVTRRKTETSRWFKNTGAANKNKKGHRVCADPLENKITRACHPIHAQMLATAAAAAESPRRSPAAAPCFTRKRRDLANFSPPFEVKLCSYLVFTV